MKNFAITDCLVKLSITIKLNDVYFLRCCCYCSSLKVIKSKTITERKQKGKNDRRIVYYKVGASQNNVVASGLKRQLFTQSE